MWSKNYSLSDIIPHIIVLALIFLSPVVVVSSVPSLNDQWREYRARCRLHTETTYRTIGVLTKSIFYKGWGKLLPEEEKYLYSREVRQ